MSRIYQNKTRSTVYDESEDQIISGETDLKKVINSDFDNLFVKSNIIMF